MAYDVRAIANYVLDLADRSDRQLTNLEINKVVFFLHAHYLVEVDKPLVSAKIEAWQHGPVFRELYREFSRFNEMSVSARATRLNPDTGIREICQESLSPEDNKFIIEVAGRYLPLRVGALYAAAHEAGGPWDRVWNHDTIANASMKISDDLIKGWFRKAARH